MAPFNRARLESAPLPCSNGHGLREPVLGCLWCFEYLKALAFGPATKPPPLAPLAEAALTEPYRAETPEEAAAAGERARLAYEKGKAEGLERIARSKA